MDKGNKVTTGSTLGTACAAVIVWAFGLAGVEIDIPAAAGLVVIGSAIGGSLSDWWTDD